MTFQEAHDAMQHTRLVVHDERVWRIHRGTYETTGVWGPASPWTPTTLHLRDIVATDWERLAESTLDRRPTADEFQDQLLTQLGNDWDRAAGGGAAMVTEAFVRWCPAMFRSNAPRGAESEDEND